MADKNNNSVELKIFAGAQAALAQYGLSKLNMSDVYRAAGVSRATLYRYFPSREELLKELRQWEVHCFVENMAQALADAAPEDRLKVMLQNVSELPQNYPSLIPLLENDPGYVLSSLKTLFPTIKAHMHNVLSPIMESQGNMEAKGLTVDQLVDCFLRLAISIYLFPDPEPGTTEKSLMSIYELWKSQV